ncbi:RICIN domain-containing protein [Kistimonas asteriae]|uniref:RICIN domain-containing protein n=1 Tax=Kistimonas asteriae TaxID=517724 RepID=UPI001BAB56C0|nr:RICIN domain-containing protein [Kistimonas asteriae]
MAYLRLCSIATTHSLAEKNCALMLSQSNRNYLPVRLALTALAVTSPLLVEAMPLSAYGPMTDFGNTLESLKSSAAHARASLPLLYLNAAMPVSEDQLSDIEDRMWAGDILLIDGTESEPQTVQAISASLGGIGLYGHVIMIYKPAFAPAQFKQIVSAGREPPNSDTAGKLVNETLALHDRWSRQQQYKTSQQRFSPSEWRPETTVQIELREINLPCLVGNQLEGTHSEPTYWTGGLIDACDHRASFSLNYQIDFIRSTSSLQGAEDAKYVRFTVNPESSGGAGWHLVDRPTHRHTWFQSWTNRTTWFGPIADYYRIDIHALDEDVRLTHSIPGSSPKHSKVKAKDTIKVGLPVRMGFTPMLEAPNPDLPDDANQEVEFRPPDQPLPLMPIIEEGEHIQPDAEPQIPVYDLSMLHGDRNLWPQDKKQRPVNNKRTFATIPAGSYYSSRSVIYLNYEYVIHNLSRSSRTDSAIWVWNREFSKYSGDWRQHEKCYLSCTDWFFSDAAFSANAYSHFTPGFSATFKVPANKSGSSSFKLASAIHPVALAGHIRYQFLFQDYSLWDQKGETYSIDQWFRVNWDASAFSILPTITLEITNKDSSRGLCLSVIEKNIAEGAAVDIYKCRSTLNQFWQHDSKQRLHSLVAKNRCLTAETNNTLSVRPCSDIKQQKWFWQDKRLMNSDTAYLTLKENHLTLTTTLRNAPIEWTPFIVPSLLDEIMTRE